MLNNEQREYAVKEVDRFVAESNKYDRRAFWDLIGVFGCAALVGVSTALSKCVDPQFANAVDTGLKVVGVGGGITLLTQCFANHSRSNVKEGNAEMVNTMVELNDLATPEGKHTKR